MNERIVIVGGPRTGKSTLAQELSWPFVRVHCADPKSLVKEPIDTVKYLPEGLPMSGDHGAAQWVADHWLTIPGPYVIEGWLMARALRRWLGRFDIGAPPVMPCDRIIVMHDIHPDAQNVLTGQIAMGKAVQTVWRMIAHNFESITEDRYWHFNPKSDTKLA